MTERDVCKRCSQRVTALILAFALSGFVGLLVLLAPDFARADGETGVTAYVHATHLILRKQAKDKGAPITQLNQNQSVTILDYKDEWVYIAYKKHKGYVKGEYLTVGQVAEARDSQSANAAADGSSGGTTATLRLEDEGTSVRELQQLLAAAGYSVSVDGQFGKGTQEALRAFQKSSGLKADGLAGAQTLDKLRAATAAPTSDANQAPRAPGSALRLDDAGDGVRELQRLLANAGYSVSTDGVFGLGTQRAVMSYQAKIGLVADGLAGKQTLDMLRGASASGGGASNGGVEMLDWWKSGSAAFSVGSRATVVDVRTGIRFTIRRWGGVNHADCEPLTAADAANMKRAYGGAWSWTRRPIWVLTHGRALAASMNGMPHMGNGLKNNDFPGHFCIHMKNSRTHGSNRVDEAHQAAVAEAYNNREKFSW